MNVLAYSTQDGEKVAAKVEELLRKETGAAAPLTWDVETTGASKVSVGTLLAEGVGLIFGRSEVRLFTIGFNLATPRAARIEINMNRQGVGCHAGTILYSTNLSKPVAGEISLEDPKTFGSSKFAGEGPAAANAEKLNSSKELLKLANAFARTKANVGGVDITAPRFFKLAPREGGSILVAATLARSYSMGFKISMESKEFFQIADLIEAAL